MKIALVLVVIGTSVFTAGCTCGRVTAGPASVDIDLKHSVTLKELDPSFLAEGWNVTDDPRHFANKQVTGVNFMVEVVTSKGLIGITAMPTSTRSANEAQGIMEPQAAPLI